MYYNSITNQHNNRHIHIYQISKFYKFHKTAVAQRFIANRSSHEEIHEDTPRNGNDSAALGVVTCRLDGQKAGGDEAGSGVVATRLEPIAVSDDALLNSDLGRIV